MATGSDNMWNYSRGGGSKVGGRFSVFTQPSTQATTPNTRRDKRQRRSTGGESGDLSELQTESMHLCLQEFKGLDPESKLDTIFECLQTIKVTNDRRLDNVERSMRYLQNHTSVTLDQIKLLQYKSVDMEARSRRCNLLFRGIPEEFGENCLSVVQGFLCDKLGIDPGSIYIHRAHRVGRPPARRSNFPIKHRPMIASFRDYQDTELILSNAYKLKSSGFGINRDLPKEILDARKPLWVKFKSEKANSPGAKLTIAYPAKLIKNGQVIADALPEWNGMMSKSRLDNSNIEYLDQQSSLPSDPNDIRNANVSETLQASHVITDIIEDTSNMDVSAQSDADDVSGDACVLREKSGEQPRFTTVKNLSVDMAQDLECATQITQKPQQTQMEQSLQGKQPVIKTGASSEHQSHSADDSIDTIDSVKTPENAIEGKGGTVVRPKSK